MNESAGDQPSTTCDIERFARALLFANGVDDVTALLFRALSGLLQPAFTCRIVLAGSPGELRDGWSQSSDLACLPLVANGEFIGAIAISASASHAGFDFDEPRVAQVARLAGAAIVARRQAGAEQSRLLKEAAELKFDVVSMLSHEMRTPLASIKGYASALLLEEIDWESAMRVEFLETIEAEADNLTKLITDMLESAAIDAGELRIEVESVEIPEIVKRVVAKIGIQTDAHRFVHSFQSDFPKVEADSQRIEQVLTNLIDNAVKYSPDGGLVVIRGEVGIGEVIVSVVDEGIGIAPEDLNKLFERFFRANPDRRRRIVGTGLGLPIADAIVRAHGGRIWAESTLGTGTTLAFALPLSSSARGAAKAAAQW